MSSERGGVNIANTAMKMRHLIVSCVLALSVILFAGCSNVPANSGLGAHSRVATGGDSRAVWARITAYARDEDKYGTHTASGVRARQGVTVAAHPDFPFGTQIKIPSLKPIVGGDGNFVVQDRGTAVTAEKASHRAGYVFDVFVDTTKRRLRRAFRGAPEWDWVQIRPPSRG
jgi:3D (Asp-Asp-Asp) domain-containing protein